MNCCNDIARIKVNIANADIATGTVAAGNSLHNGILTFPCAGFREGGMSKIVQVYLQLQNGSGGTCTGEFNLHLYRHANLTNQTKGDTVITTIADNNNKLCTLKFDALSAVGGNINISDDMQITNIYIQLNDNDTAIYGILETREATIINSNAQAFIQLIIHKL